MTPERIADLRNAAPALFRVVRAAWRIEMRADPHAHDELMTALAAFCNVESAGG